MQAGKLLNMRNDKSPQANENFKNTINKIGDSVNSVSNIFNKIREKSLINSSAGSKLENERMLNRPRLPTTDMGMKEGMLRARAEAMLGQRSNLPTTDMGMSRGIEKARIMEELRAKDKQNSDYMNSMKPIFRINSLDKQYNDPLKTGSIDSFRGATDVKPLPSQTFMGTRSAIITPSNN